MEVNEKAVRQALAGLAAESRLSGIDVRNGQITVALQADKSQLDELAPLRNEIETRLQKIPGAKRVLITFTSERAAASEKMLPQVKSVIAVASGKGGVGKSTTAANLALAFAARGYTAGLLDADIYGPSVPHLFGLERPPEQGDSGKIVPATAHGIKIMSIGLMVSHDAPLAWRGPMIDKALTQFLRDVDWGALDILLIDMPPGTGDAQITLVKRAPLDGAVIVSTPQDLSLIDAQKGIALFRQTGVPVLGLIENMSRFICPQCGKVHDIFAHGGARKEALRQGIPFLGEVPLHMKIRESSDSGAPLVVVDAESAQAQAYFEIADRMSAELGLRAADAAVNKS